MVMTRGQWEALQLRLPPEDRETYENYLKSNGITTAPATPLAAAEGGLKAAQSIETQTTGETPESLTTPDDPRFVIGQGTVTPSGRPTITSDKTGEKPGRAWIKKDGKWVKPDIPTDNNTVKVVSSRKLSNGEVSQILQTISYEWNDNRGWVKKTSTETKRLPKGSEPPPSPPSPPTPPTPPTETLTKEQQIAAARAKEARGELLNDYELELLKSADATVDIVAKDDLNAKPGTQPGTQPGKAWILSEDGKSWVKPKAPADGKEYNWDDDKGWTVVTEPNAGGPGEQPGKAWILSADGKTWIKPTMPTDGEYIWNDETGYTKKTVTPTVTIFDSQYIGTGANRVLRTYYSNGTFTDTAAAEVVAGGAATQDAATLQLLTQLQAQNATLMAQMAASQQQAQADAKAAAEAAAKEKRESAIKILTDRFTKYGLASLVPRIIKLANSGANEETITLELMESEEYQIRFKANQDRIKKGLAVLDPGDYLALEDDYRQILRAYGLKAFDTDDYVQQFIANDIAITELSNRVVTAVQRVQNADPAILTTLRSFYGISDNDLVAYVLDPNQQFQKIERQVAAAEIGAAAGLQGFKVGKEFAATAEQLAAQGVTKAEARKGYSTIADILPTAEKLSQIYGGVEEGYGLAEAEQEVFNSLASAQRKRRRLTEREIASFSGQSGVGKTSLTKQTGGTY